MTNAFAIARSLKANIANGHGSSNGGGRGVVSGPDEDQRYVACVEYTH